MADRCLSRTLCRSTFIATVVMVMAGCSWFSEDTEMKEAESLPPLDVPPDLIRPYSDDKVVKPALPETTAGKECQCDDQPPKIGEAVLPAGKGVKRVRDGQHRWLQVAAEPEQVWPLARKFLEMRGYQVSRDEPAIGLMETDWKNRFDNSGDTVSSSRERLRFRLEPGQQTETTEVYLSQYSSVRVEASSEQAVAQEEKWQLREQDNERAIEMLNRFARYLVAENVEEAVPLTRLASHLESDGDNGSALVVEADLNKTWRRTGIALDALGFVIEDRDQVNRIYTVYHEMPTGKTEEELQHGKPEPATVKEEYRVHLDQVDSETRISVRNEAGQVDNSDPALHLLNLLHGQFQ
ncbi:outer membrane protein assembly factor BamC [Kaarinaea lacus]